MKLLIYKSRTKIIFYIASQMKRGRESNNDAAQGKIEDDNVAESIVLQNLAPQCTIATLLRLASVNKYFQSVLLRRAADVLRVHPAIPARAKVIFAANISHLDAFDCLIMARRILDSPLGIYAFLYMILDLTEATFSDPLVEFTHAMLDTGDTLRNNDLGALFKWSGRKFLYARSHDLRYNVALWTAFERAGRQKLRGHLFPMLDTTIAVGDTFCILAESRQQARNRDYENLHEWLYASSVHEAIVALPLESRGRRVIIKKATLHEINVQTKLTELGAAVPNVLAADATMMIMDYYPYSLLSDLHHVKDITRMFGTIASALNHLKGMRMWHNDLFPRNIFFDEEENYVLGDFGEASIRKKGASRRDPLVPPSVPLQLAFLAEELLNVILSWRNTPKMPELRVDMEASIEHILSNQ